MQERPRKISDLLALRDGEPVEAGLSASDPTVAAELATLNTLKRDLQSMPDVPLDDAVWMQHMPTNQKRSAWLRFPLATAASVFFASVVGMYLIFGGEAQVSPDFSQDAQFASATSMDASGLRLAGLMRQSRDLEQQLYGRNPLSQAADGPLPQENNDRAPSRSEALLLFRLADVDGEIARLYDEQIVDEQQRQRLWTKRVELLQNLVAVKAGTDPRYSGNARSM